MRFPSRGSACVFASALALAFSISCNKRNYNASGVRNAVDAGAEPMPSAETPEGIGQVKAWAAQRVRSAEQTFAQSGLARFPSPPWWGKEVVYQIQVDRFADGDPANNEVNLEAHQKSALMSEEGIADFRHGGDLQGIIDRLDYLKRLGVTSLWITPVLQSNGSYHGYCTSDFTRVDGGFSLPDPEGGRRLLRTLVAEAHRRGIKVVLDVVVNHVCDPGSRYDDAATPFSREAYDRCVQTKAGNNWNGHTEVQGQRRMAFGPSFFPPFRNQNFLSRCGHGGESNGDAAVWGDFSDAMFDLDTNNWDFQEIFTELHKFWVAYADVDGFRADAAKHVTSDFMAYFSTEIRKYAASIGKDNFYIVGEVAGSTDEQGERVGTMKVDPTNPDSGHGQVPEKLIARIKSVKGDYLAHPRFRKPGLNAIYDFGHSSAAVGVNRGDSSPMALKTWFWAGGETDANVPGSEFGKLVGIQDTRENWNVLEIHDWPRFLLYAKGGQSQDGFEAFNALGYLLTAPGVPVIYYGLEQGLNGDCHADKVTVSAAARERVNRICSADDFGNHARYRQDMFITGPWRLGSVVPEINGLAGIGRATVEAGAPKGVRDPYLNTHHALFQHAAKLIDMRKSCRPLSEGGIYFRAVHKDPGNRGGGFFAFSRVAGGDEVVVLVNASGSPRPVDRLVIDRSLHSDEQGHKFVNMVDMKARATVTDGGGILDFEDGYALPPNSVAVFYPEGMVVPRPDGGGVCR